MINVTIPCDNEHLESPRPLTPNTLFISRAVEGWLLQPVPKVGYAEAEPLYQRALEIHKKALGREHPGVATDLNNLAALYRAQGKYDEAQPLHQRALAIWERRSGGSIPTWPPPLAIALLYCERPGALARQRIWKPEPRPSAPSRNPCSPA